MTPRPKQPAEVRNELINTLGLDLIGPTPDDTLHDYEELDRQPSRWYLSGFLVPYEAKFDDRSDPTADDEFNEPNENKNEDDPTPESSSARKVCFPSSMGLSFLVDSDTTQLEVTATWGDYEAQTQESSEAPEAAETATDKTRNPLRDDAIWCRTPRRDRLTVDIPNHGKPKPIDLPHSLGLKLVISVIPKQRG